MKYLLPLLKGKLDRVKEKSKKENNFRKFNDFVQIGRHIL